jgi:hypothetical protein
MGEDRNRNLIIIVVAILLICCCCVLIGAGYQWGGDFIVDLFEL